MRIVSIIPARGGSKRLPGKNLAQLCGKPLIGWSIEVGLACSRIDLTVVSTDDHEIASVARSYGASVIDRPIELAGDSIPTQPVLVHALRALQERGEPADVVVLLQPTSPLRTVSHIDEALDLFDGEGSVISVRVVDDHPYKSIILEDGETPKPVRSWNYLEFPGHTLPLSVRPNGAIYICPGRSLIERGTLFNVPVRLYQMDRDVSVDIDTHEDLKLAELYLSSVAPGM